MLNINNKDDVEKMMQYHRTRDMLRGLFYFPDISPIRNLTIVSSIEDYLENIDFCKKLPGERNDTLITKKSMDSIEGTGINPDILSIFKKVKEIDNDGVMVLFDLIDSPSERYDRYAGVSVRVTVGEGVLIEAVGKGFDGREVSKGLDRHEIYYIPWLDLRTLNINNFRNYRKYIISQEDYINSRKKRVEYLQGLNIPLELIESKVPVVYQEIPDLVWLDLLKHLLKKLIKMEDELLSEGINEFVLNGHMEGERFRPWQMYDKSRFCFEKNNSMVKSLKSRV